MPVLIAFAISTHACSPLEHCRLRLFTAAVSGKPAANAAARNSVAPPPGGKTDPTLMSSTKAGSSFERDRRALNAPYNRSEAAVSLKPPLPPLVKGVRRAQVTTMSSGCFARIDSEPRGMSDSEERRWEVTWDRRCCAKVAVRNVALPQQRAHAHPGKTSSGL